MLVIDTKCLAKVYGDKSVNRWTIVIYHQHNKINFMFRHSRIIHFYKIFGLSSVINPYNSIGTKSYRQASCTYEGWNYTKINIYFILKSKEKCDLNKFVVITT